MRYLKPHFYDKFVCTAGDCPDTCCAGWQIMIDDASLEKYKNVQGEFGKRLPWVGQLGRGVLLSE